MAVLFALATFLSTAAGGLIALRRRQDLDLVMAVAAGLLVGAAVFDLLPDAWELARPRRLPLVIACAAGFVAFQAVDWLVHRARREGSREAAFGAIAALGLTLHSFLDGVAIGGAFHVDARMGVLVGVAVVAHDFGDGVSTVGVVLGARGALRSSLAWLLADAAAPVVGALVALRLPLEPPMLAALLAFFAGSFFFVGGAHLLPDAIRSGRRTPVVAAFLTSVGAAGAAAWLSR